MCSSAVEILIVKLIFFICSRFILIPDEIHNFYSDEMNVQLRRKVLYVILFQTYNTQTAHATESLLRNDIF